MFNLFGNSKGPLKQPPNRELIFEVMALRDERWLIEKVFAYEEDAIAFADELLGDEAVLKVQVIRERRAKGGLTQSKPVYECEQKRKAGKPAITVKAPPTRAGWCESVEDLYSDASRRTLGRLLRAFLDKQAATPSELLYDYRLTRKLDTAGSLTQSAIHRVAKAQAERRSQPAGERVRELERLVAQAIALAREYGAERKRPRLGETGLAGLARAAAKFRSDPFQRSYAVRYAIAEALREIPNLAGKLDRVLELAPETPDEGEIALLDGLIADCLGSASVVQTLLGRQPNLGSALDGLVRLALGRHDGTGEGAPPALVQVNRLIVGHGLPATRAILIDRLQSELDGERALMRGEPLEQRQAIERIGTALHTPEGGYLGGAPMADALARRARRLGLMGGVVAPSFKSSEPVACLRRILEEEKRHFGDSAKRGFATYALDLLDGFACDPATLAELAAGFEASDLSPVAKRAILGRLTQCAHSQDA